MFGGRKSIRRSRAHYPILWAVVAVIGMGVLAAPPAAAAERCPCFNAMQVIGTCKSVLNGDEDAVAVFVDLRPSFVELFCISSGQVKNPKQWIYNLEQASGSCWVGFTKNKMKHNVLINSAEDLSSEQIQACTWALDDAVDSLPIE